MREVLCWLCACSEKYVIVVEHVLQRYVKETLHALAVDTILSILRFFVDPSTFFICLWDV